MTNDEWAGEANRKAVTRGQSPAHRLISAPSMFFTIRHSAFVICLLAATLVQSCHKPRPPKSHVDPSAPVDIVLPDHGAYTGAFMDFGDEEDDVTLEMVEEFEAMVGKHQAIIASSSYWGEQNFPTDNLNVLWRH